MSLTLVTLLEIQTENLWIKYTTAQCCPLSTKTQQEGFAVALKLALSTDVHNSFQKEHSHYVNNITLSYSMRNVETSLHQAPTYLLSADRIHNRLLPQTNTGKLYCLL
jgi:hypothetical protein